MEINDSARRHGVPDEDILHAVERSMLEYEVVGNDSPRRWMIFGPDRAGLMLEVVVLVFDDGAEMVIHAMSMRSKYQELFPGGEQ